MTMADGDDLRRKSAPRGMARGDQESPRSLRPIAETWGAAPMPHPEPSRQRRVAAAIAVGGASLATVASLALFMSRPTCTTNLDHSSDNWMSVARRQIFPFMETRAAGEMPVAIPVGGAPPPVVERSDPAHSSLRTNSKDPAPKAGR